jgi:hypothetical protein
MIMRRLVIIERRRGSLNPIDDDPTDNPMGIHNGKLECHARKGPEA